MQGFLRRVWKVVKNPAYILWAVNVRATILRKRFLSLFSSGKLVKQQRAVMFHLGRSGSTVMADLLNQHSSIYWGGEIAKGVIREQLDSKAERLRSFQRLLERELRAARRSKFYGFEIKPFHLEYLGVSADDFVKMMVAKGFDKFIILERKNLLRKVLSSMIASQYGVWHQPKSVASERKVIHVNPGSITIDGEKKTLLKYLSDYEEDLASVRAALERCSKLELRYEDHIMPSPEHAAEMCYAYLGVKDWQPVARYGKTNPQKVSEIVSNFDEVAGSLRGTRYEWMLDA